MDDLTPKEREGLEAAIEEAKDPKNLKSWEEVEKELRMKRTIIDGVCYYLWWRPVRFFEDIWYFITREIPHYFKYGYSRKDIWCLYFVIAKFVLPRLIELKEKDHGMPYQEGMTDEEMLKQWHGSLDKMIWAFKFVCDEESEFWNTGVNSKEEDWGKVQEGLAEFAKHFLDLAD